MEGFLRTRCLSRGIARPILVTGSVPIAMLPVAVWTAPDIDGRNLSIERRHDRHFTRRRWFGPGKRRGNWKRVRERLGIHHPTRTDIPQRRLAGNLSAVSSRTRDCGHPKHDADRDQRDHHQQFDQSESSGGCRTSHGQKKPTTPCGGRRGGERVKAIGCSSPRKYPGFYARRRFTSIAPPRASSAADGSGTSTMEIRKLSNCAPGFGFNVSTAVMPA